MSAAVAGIPSAWLVNTNFFQHPFPDVWPGVSRTLGELGVPASAVARVFGDAVLVPDLAYFEPLSALPAPVLAGLAGAVGEIRHVGPIPVSPVSAVPDRDGSRARLSAPDGRRLLYVTMGGTAQGLPSLRAVIPQLGRLEADATVVLGPHISPAEVGAVPENVTLVGFTDQSALLIRAADLVVCHGGHTTVMEAICLGTPALSVPQQPEQAQNARRLVELGVGRVIGPKDLPSSFLPSVTEMLGDQTLRQRSASVAEVMREHDGAAAAADHLTLLGRLHGLRREPG